jgi:hypothetical protein
MTSRSHKTTRFCFSLYTQPNLNSQPHQFTNRTKVQNPQNSFMCLLSQTFSSTFPKSSSSHFPSFISFCRKPLYNYEFSQHMFAFSTSLLECMLMKNKFPPLLRLFKDFFCFRIFFPFSFVDSQIKLHSFFPFCSPAYHNPISLSSTCYNEKLLQLK